MSKNHRDRSGGKKESKSNLLNELDSLKSLLNEKEEEDLNPAPWEYTPPKALTTQKTQATASNKVGERPRTTSPASTERPHNRITDKKPAEIPVLKEVAFTADNKPATVPTLADTVEKAGNNRADTPNGKELMNLVELLVERRLNKLRPVLTEEILKELMRLNPSLKIR